MRDRPIIFSGPMVRALLDGRKTMTRRVIKLGRRLPEFCGGHGDLLDPTCWGWEDTENGDWITLEKDRGQRLGWRDLRTSYRAGDRLWVREAHNTWNAHGQHRDDGKRWGPWGGLPTQLSPDRTRIAYFREGFDRCDPGPWRPSIHMPRWASRLTLTITDVRVERVQEITAEDAVAEGIYRVDPTADDEAWYRAWCAERGAEPDLPMASVWMAPGTRQGWGLTREDRNREKWGPTPQFAFRCAWDSLNAKRGLGWDANPWVAALTFEVHRCNIDQMPAS